MEANLERLVEKLEKEAVDAAQQQAAAIVQQARQEAQSIVEAAQEQAQARLEEAGRQAEKVQRNGQLALKQAARDVQLLLKDEILQLFDRVFKREVSAALEPDFLEQLILTIAGGWAQDPEIEVVLSQGDRDKLAGMLEAKLGAEVKNNVTLRVNGRINKGIRIGAKDGQAYYDLTDEGLAELLLSGLNPSLRAVLENKDG